MYLDCRLFGFSGIGTYIENLIDSYGALAPDLPLRLLVPDEIKSEMESRSPFPNQSYNSPIYSLREQFAWAGRIRSTDWLHVPHYNAPVLFPGKLIVTVHDVCHLAMRQFFPGILKSFYSTVFLGRVLNKAKHIITVSQFSKNEIIRFFKIRQEKISVVYNGVNPRFRPIPSEQTKGGQKRLELPGEYMLFVGNIKPHKNIIGVLSGYKLALEREQDLPPLVILGNNIKMMELIPEIRIFLEDPAFQNRIIFTGYLPKEDLPAIYTRAMLFLFPSLYEGFGLPVLEAMACGTPVITSDTTSLPEVAGDAALLVNPESHQDISESILRLCSDNKLRDELIEKGLKQAGSFSWTKSAEQHLGIYKRFI